MDPSQPQRTSERISTDPIILGVWHQCWRATFSLKSLNMPFKELGCHQETKFWSCTLCASSSNSQCWCWNCGRLLETRQKGRNPTHQIPTGFVKIRWIEKEKERDTKQCPQEGRGCTMSSAAVGPVRLPPLNQQMLPGQQALSWLGTSGWICCLWLKQ